MGKKIIDIKEIIWDDIEMFFISSQKKMENEKWYTRLKKTMESSGMNLLNCLYWFNFIGFEKSNEAVIDGEDSGNNIWIQITIRTDKPKYRDDTINKFPPNWKSHLKKLLFLTLVYEPSWNKTYKSWRELNKSNLVNNFDFNVATDIYTFDRIHTEIIWHTDINKVFDVVVLLYKIFPDYFQDLYNKIYEILSNITDLQNIKSARLNIQNDTFSS